MKAERLGDGKIRFTLEAADLAERDLKVGDLNYGSPEAKELFADMVTEAGNQFGVELEGHPLVIEAVPLSDDSLVVTLTEVKDIENTAELLTGTPGPQQKRMYFPDARSLGIDSKAVPVVSAAKKEAKKKKEPLPFVFAFAGMEPLVAAARCLVLPPKMQNALYHSDNGNYYLIVKPMWPSSAQSRYALSVLSEYAFELMDIPYAKTMVEEHCKPVIKALALQKMHDTLCPKEKN